MSDDNRGSIGVIVIGGGLVYNGVKRILKSRRVQDTASNKIAHAPQGNVEVEGYSWPLNGGFKTYSGKHCSYYSCRLERLEDSGKRRYWSKVWSHTPTKEFLVIDSTGAVIVNPTAAEITSRAKITNWKSIDPSSDISHLVESSYKKISTGFFSSDHRIVEEFILAGSPCYIQGNLHTPNVRETVEDSNARQFYSYIQRRLRKKVHNNHRLDSNRDGVITHIEAQLFIHNVAKKIISGHGQGTLDKGETLQLFGQIYSAHSSKLIVSDMHEHHFLGHLNQWNFIKIIGGAMLISFGLASLFF